MDAEMQEIIKKHLPAQLGETLKKRLEQADEDADTVKNQKEQILSKDSTIRGLEKTITEYKKFDEINKGLEAREKVIADKESKLKIEELTYQLSSEKEKTKFASDVALGLVRNIEYRNSTFKNKTIPFKNQHGYVERQSHEENSGENKTTV